MTVVPSSMPTIERFRRYTATLRIRRGEGFPPVRPEAELHDGQRVTVEAGWQFVGEDAEMRPEYAGEWAMLYVGESRKIGTGWTASGDLADLELVPDGIRDVCTIEGVTHVFGGMSEIYVAPDEPSEPLERRSATLFFEEN